MILCLNGPMDPVLVEEFFAESFLAFAYGAHRLSMDGDALTDLLRRYPNLDELSVSDLAQLPGERLDRALEQIPTGADSSPAHLLRRIGRMRLVRNGDTWELRNADWETLDLCRALGVQPLKRWSALE